MKKMSVISVIVNRNFAFVKGNRPTNSKAVTAKMKSIEEYGLLSPITVVDGEQVITSGGHLVDLNGKDSGVDIVSRSVARGNSRQRRT